jgi:signal transduction histidine kinase/CheY-like chemotaxis protein
VVFETIHQRKNGSHYHVEVHLQLQRFKNHERFVAIILDITERKKAEEENKRLGSQLHQAQKMESIGRLAGGVAHDYNNMLGVILGYTEMALDKLYDDDPLHKDLTEIQRAAERSAGITRQLLAFSRQQTIAPKVLDLNQAITNLRGMLRRLIGEDIELGWHPGESLWPIYMDPVQLDQILMNLCVNARDAITDVGTISIETEKTTLDDGYCRDHYGFVPGDFVVLSVTDTGCGMDRGTRDKLFEPFFTTKARGKGTGLGLATVYGIIKQNNCFINVYSELGQGSTFTVYFPRHRGDEQSTVLKPAASLTNRQGHETILLLEDEEAILTMTTMMLKGLGYTVLACNTPNEALETAAQQNGHIHLLITDVVMPQMNGRELSERLKEHCPDIKTLFMSGYTADVIAHRGVLDKGVNFIQKPFSTNKLARQVRETLDT